LKKTIIVIVVCLFALIVVGFLFFKPVPIITSPYTVADSTSVYSESDVSISLVIFNGADVTDSIEKETFIRILSEYDCRRSFSNPFPYPSLDMVWENVYTLHATIISFIMLC
jgi:hypothetical protein